jgi:hypothetical protein
MKRSGQREKGRNVPGIPRRIPFSAGYLVIRLLIGEKSAAAPSSDRRRNVNENQLITAPRMLARKIRFRWLAAGRCRTENDGS